MHDTLKQINSGKTSLNDHFIFMYISHAFHKEQCI